MPQIWCNLLTIEWHNHISFILSGILSLKGLQRWLVILTTPTGILQVRKSCLIWSLSSWESGRLLYDLKQWCMIEQKILQFFTGAIKVKWHHYFRMQTKCNSIEFWRLCCIYNKQFMESFEIDHRLSCHLLKLNCAWQGQTSTYRAWQDKNSTYRAWQGKNSTNRAWQCINSTYRAWQGKKSTYHAWQGKTSTYRTW